MQNDESDQIREITHKELEEETTARIDRISKEFADGFDFINRFSDTVTFFGSARLSPDSRHYQQARELAVALAEDGYTIVTGGGGGIMEAGDRGAKEANGQSLGLNIKLPHEQAANPYATDTMSFKYFFTRKVMLAYGATAYVYFPGGFGTFDELFEIITLIQTKKMPKVPIILVGGEFWTALDMYIRTYMLKELETISPGDEELYTITDDVTVIRAMINNHRDSSSALAVPPPQEIVAA